jgi:ankyrin repeat protein
MTGNVPIVRLLVKLPGLDVNLADNEGNTALHLASQAGKNSFFFLNCSF